MNEPLTIPKVLLIGTQRYDVLRHVPATAKTEEHLEIRGQHWSRGSIPTVYPWPPRTHVVDREEAGTLHLKSKV